MVDAQARPRDRAARAHAPWRLRTGRLELRRPNTADAHEIFTRYSSDPAVTRFLGWPTHQTLADTLRFLAYCDAEWDCRGVGPYLVYSRDGGMLLGSAALCLETPWQAAAGYVFARDAWGQGHATEALYAMRGLAAVLGVHRLYAVCHPSHVASRRVMEKAGLSRDTILRRRAHFPNLHPATDSDVICYAAALPGARG